MTGIDLDGMHHIGTWRFLSGNDVEFWVPREAPKPGKISENKCLWNYLPPSAEDAELYETIVGPEAFRRMCEYYEIQHKKTLYVQY